MLYYARNCTFLPYAVEEGSQRSVPTGLMISVELCRGARTSKPHTIFPQLSPTAQILRHNIFYCLCLHPLVNSVSYPTERKKYISYFCVCKSSELNFPKFLPAYLLNLSCFSFEFHIIVFQSYQHGWVNLFLHLWSLCPISVQRFLWVVYFFQFFLFVSEYTLFINYFCSYKYLFYYLKIFGFISSLKISCFNLSYYSNLFRSEQRETCISFLCMYVLCIFIEL